MPQKLVVWLGFRLPVHGSQQKAHLQSAPSTLHIRLNDK